MALTGPVHADCTFDRCSVSGNAEFVAVSHERGKRSAGKMRYEMVLAVEAGTFVIVGEDSSTYATTNHALDERRVALVAQVQRQLARHGCAPGPVDGLWGDKSRAALNSFARAIGRGLGSEPSSAVLAALSGRARSACS